MNSQEIIDIAHYVYSELGQGHTEKTYQRGMQAVMNHRRIFHTTEAPVPISILGQVIACGRCDILVGIYALELKANSTPPSRATGQLLKYLTGLNEAAGDSRYRGMVINFNQKNDVVEYLEIIPPVAAIVVPVIAAPVVVAKTIKKIVRSRYPFSSKSTVEQFVEMHLKPVKDANALVSLTELRESFERFNRGPMEMSTPEFARKLNTALRRTTISSDSGTARLAAYGSRNDRTPGLLLMA